MPGVIPKTECNVMPLFFWHVFMKYLWETISVSKQKLACFLKFELGGSFNEKAWWPYFCYCFAHALWPCEALLSQAMRISNMSNMSGQIWALRTRLDPNMSRNGWEIMESLKMGRKFRRDLWKDQMWGQNSRNKIWGEKRRRSRKFLNDSEEKARQ